MLERMAGRMVTGRVAFLICGLIDVAVLTGYLARRRWSRRRVGGAALTLALMLGCGAAMVGVGWESAGVARADTTEQSILMDDGAFIYSSPAKVLQHLRQVADLGVTTVKVSMVWSLVAPDASSRHRPAFDAAHPDAYPVDAWTRYDTLVQEAGALGLRVYFQLTAPAPLWATNPKVSGFEHPWSHDISTADFAAFARAVGARYSGSFPVTGDRDTYGPEAEASATSVTGTTTTGMTGTGTGTTTTGSGATAAPATIPAVRMWGIWNEPNEVGWISPQTRSVHGVSVPTAPVTERHLIDGGYGALVATGHAHDTILIGETASGGNTHTIPFIQALFCVDSHNRRLSGRAAALEDCPAHGSARNFVADNPGLFRASGWAHHPYSFDHTPATPFAGKPWLITLANLSELSHELDAVDAAYGQPTRLPLYMTEYGFKSNPPNPYVHTTLGEQETWLDEGWYLSYRIPRVKALAQELLYDQPPMSGQRPGSLAYWDTIDSGLEFQDGAPKPAYDAFRLPIWLPLAHTGRRVEVWAEIRPAQVAKDPFGVLEYRAPRSRTWSVLAVVETTSPEGFLDTHVAIPHPGLVRLGWLDSLTGAADYSRTVTVTAAPRQPAAGTSGNGTGALSSSSRR